MPKKGTQIHDEYWRHYIAIPKHSKKSDLGKKHAQLFREYKYKKIIGELVDNSNLTLECADIKLSKEETVDIIFYLFYPHLKLGEALITKNFRYKKDFILLLSIELNTYNSKTDFSPYIDTRNGKKKISNNLNIEHINQNIPGFFKYFLFDFSESKKTKCSISYSGLISQIAQIMNVCPYSRRKFDCLEYQAVSQWYNRLFNEKYPYFFAVEGEDKHLEQQLLDMYYGGSLIGYLYHQHHIELESSFIDACEYFRILGLSDGIKKILDSLVASYYKRDEKAYNEYSSVIEETHIFTNNILKIFKEFMLGFNEYIYHLGTYKNRKKYFDRAHYHEPQYNTENYWKYILKTDYLDIDMKKISELARLVVEFEPYEFEDLKELLKRIKVLYPDNIISSTRLSDLNDIIENAGEAKSESVNLTKLTEKETKMLAELTKRSNLTESIKLNELKKQLKFATQNGIDSQEHLARIAKLLEDAENIMPTSSSDDEEFIDMLYEDYLFQEKKGGLDLKGFFFPDADDEE